MNESCEESNNSISDTNLDQSNFVLENSNTVMYYCDKYDFEYEEEDAVKTQRELQNENSCDKCGENFDERT